MEILPQDLRWIRERYKESRIVFVNGVFDLIHPGHIFFFEHCKKQGDVLVVGLGNDIQVAELKPGRPLYPERWRRKIVASLKPVDYCFVSTQDTIGQHHLKIVELAFEALHPNVYIINDDATDIPRRRELTKRFGIEFIIVERMAYAVDWLELSTTTILKKIRES